jgi:hypothetical protein
VVLAEQVKAIRVRRASATKVPLIKERWAREGSEESLAVVRLEPMRRCLGSDMGRQRTVRFR